MAAVNKCIMVGNLTADPKLSYTTRQTAVADVGLAVNRKYKRDGESIDDTCFLDVRAFAGTAEALAKYCRKGSLVYMEGYLAFEKWEGKDDHKTHSRHRLIVERVQFLDGKGARNAGREAGEDHWNS